MSSLFLWLLELHADAIFLYGDYDCHQETTWRWEWRASTAANSFSLKCLHSPYFFFAVSLHFSPFPLLFSHFFSIPHLWCLNGSLDETYGHSTTSSQTVVIPAPDTIIWAHRHLLSWWTWWWRKRAGMATVTMNRIISWRWKGIIVVRFSLLRKSREEKRRNQWFNPESRYFLL